MASPHGELVFLCIVQCLALSTRIFTQLVGQGYVLQGMGCWLSQYSSEWTPFRLQENDLLQARQVLSESTANVGQAVHCARLADA